MDKKYIALLYRNRANALGKSDNETDKQAAKVDFMTAAMISEDDARPSTTSATNGSDDKAGCCAACRSACSSGRSGSLTREPEPVHALLDSLGWAYVENGRLPEGLEHIRRAIETSPEESAEKYYHLADTYRRLGRDDEALQAIDRALAPAARDPVKWRTWSFETLRLLEPERPHVAADPVEQRWRSRDRPPK